MEEGQVRRTSWLIAKHGLLVLVGLAIVFAWLDSIPVSRPGRMTKREAATGRAMQLTNAVKQFYVEYDHYPAGLSGGTPVRSERTFLEVLLGVDRVANPKGIPYLPELPEVTDRSAGPGIRRDASGLSLVDSWGRAYLVLVDDDRDGMVMNPQPDGKPALIPSTVLVWSGGQDGDPETWEDNVTSWMRK